MSTGHRGDYGNAIMQKRGFLPRPHGRAPIAALQKPSRTRGACTGLFVRANSGVGSWLKVRGATNSANQGMLAMTLRLEGLYEKVGFQRMAEFEGWPEGHVNVVLCKTL
jgi:hypothetical protein